MSTGDRKLLTTGALIGGGLVAAAAAVLIKEKLAEKPEYAVVETDGRFEVRDYPAVLVAETIARGPRRVALNTGFERLAAYIFAKSRSGEKIAMTAPVLSERAPASTATTTLADGGGLQGWRVRFVMPAKYTTATLPAPPEGVQISKVAARRVAAVRFSGLANDAALQAQEHALRQWLEQRGTTAVGHAEHAFYDAPFVPPPLRRNEIILALR